MPYTTLGEVFATNREASYAVMQSYMDADPVSTTPFHDSGLLVSNPIIAEIAASATGITELPYWLEIDPSVEPNYSNDQYQDIAVPRSIGTGHLKARNCHLNEGFGSMTLVNEITGKDPLQRIASRLDRYWRQEAELRVVATLKGLLATSVADDLGLHVEGDADLDGLIDAQFSMGDAFGAIDGYVMHSSIFSRLVKADLAEVRRNRETNLLERTVNGMPALVNDRAMTSATNQPVVALLGRGAFAYGMARPKAHAEEYAREAARGNGGGVDTLWTRRNMIVHPTGFDFLSASITGNGTETVARGAGWIDLANSANWDLAEGVDRKQIPIAFLTVTTPVTP